MPKRDIEYVQGGYYHVYNRGAGGHHLFIETENYLYVIRQMKKYSYLLQVTIIAYCLMPNHYHYLIRQAGEIPVSELPKRLSGGYSRAVNKRYGWSGTLFEGRYQAKVVSTTAYLCHLCRYMHANPVKDGLVSRLEEWPYSNYMEWTGQRKGLLVDHGFIEDLFGNASQYEEFVEEYLESRQLPEELAYLAGY